MKEVDDKEKKRQKFSLSAVIITIRMIMVAVVRVVVAFVLICTLV